MPQASARFKLDLGLVVATKGRLIEAASRRRRRHPARRPVARALGYDLPDVDRARFGKVEVKRG